MLVASNELNGGFVSLRQVSRVGHVEIEGYGLIPIQTADVPLVSASNTNVRVRDVGVLSLARSHLADCSTHLHLLGAEDL